MQDVRKDVLGPQNIAAKNDTVLKELNLLLFKFKEMFLSH